MSDQAKKDVTPNLVIIRHTSGSKANQVEQFPLDQYKELTFGRTTTSSVKYDPDQDDLVSREHATIEQAEDNPNQFTITDLSSRNGTFVNKQRIIGVAHIKPGDEIQFGPGGPSFEFDLDPRPDSLMKATRLAEGPGAAMAPPVKATRENPSKPEAAPDRETVVPAKTSVGKATVERMLDHSQRQSKKQSQRLLLFGGAGVLVLAILAIAFWPTPPPPPPPPPPADDGTMTHAEIAAANNKKVVLIEMAWKLYETSTGGQVYHAYVPDQKQGEQQAPCRALYQDQDGKEVPALTLEEKVYGQFDPDGTCVNKAIGASGGTGSGFVVGADGLIMTNRHVAYPWLHGYSFPQDAIPGVKFTQNQQGEMERKDVEQAPWQWIPGKAVPKSPMMQGKRLAGKHDYLNVVFPGTTLRREATPQVTSQRHDVAIITVGGLGDPLPSVTLNDNYDTIKTGEVITIMGYPGISPLEVTGQVSQSFDDRSQEYYTRPDPTVTPGTIGRILRNQERAPNSNDSEDRYSRFGDYYQLTASETGAGNSGGPVFDDKGNVIGIFTASRDFRDATRVTFALPIRYGLELLKL